MRTRSWLFVCVSVYTLGCGRLDYDPLNTPPDPPPDEAVVVLEALDGTVIPAGSSVTIAVSLTPDEAAVAGTSVRLTTDGGELVGPDGRGTEVDLVVDSDGQLADIRLHARLDARPDVVLSVTANALETAGDQVYTVADPDMYDVVVDSRPVTATAGFTVEHVVTDGAERAALMGRSGRLLIPPAQSSFGSDPYLVVSGTPPEVYRITDDSLERFSISPGNPDEGVAQAVFADPAGPHGDLMFVCSASSGGGDGVFTVDSLGNWSTWRSFNNCNGLAIDESQIAGDPGYPAPVYLDVNSETLERAEPGGGAVEQLTDSLVWGFSGIKLYINQSGPFPTGLYLVYPGYQAPDVDGFVHYVTSTDGGWQAPAVFAEPLRGPNAAVFTSGTRFGDLLLLAMGMDGELRAFRPDGTSFLFLMGLTGNFDVVLDPRDQSLWLYEPDSALVLRVASQ